MKITIRVEEQIPYTKGYVQMERQIDAEALHDSEFDLAKSVIQDMQTKVLLAVDHEMKIRGIVLGEDGLRIENK